MSVAEKKAIRDIKIFNPAKSIESVIREYGFKESEVIKLAGNESRYGVSPKVLEALQSNADQYSLYPDAKATRLAEILEKKHNIAKEHFVFGHGSFELISMIANAYIEEGDETIAADPTFGWYASVTASNKGKLIRVPVDENQALDLAEMKNRITEKTKIIWICNPNNPTGTVIAENELKTFINSVSDNILIVLDEAYIDFVDGEYFDTVPLVKEHDNVIILRSFSKTYGLASFRLGYSISTLAIAEALTKVKMPGNTSHASQVAAIAAIEDEEFKNKVITTIKQERQYYYEQLDRLGLTYTKSNGNYILVHTGISGAELERKFVEQKIIIRNGAEFGERYRDYIRISIGLPEDNRKVVKILTEIITKQ